MLRHRLYYTVKPFLPWRLRMCARRFLAQRKRKLCGEIWPISRSSAQRPSWWPGWPGGKKFALVLTHDVEGPEGLAKVQRLAETEMKLGLRSSFNFIPESSYSVPPSLRAWLTERGFEVGVHDLEHDGRLFGSRRGFSSKAARINSYLRDWNAVGFRSGFMLRNLEWLHGLDIEYDSSTFDTDPFEFQPEGANSIFPFWIASSQSGETVAAADATKKNTARPGYVELPYTLPQDSTLFLVLKETTPAIWLQKLDWIADHGGMALVNVHPDYVRFDGEPSSERTFPVGLYSEFLSYVQHKYAGAFWHAVPKDVAAHVRRSLSPFPSVSRDTSS